MVPYALGAHVFS